MRASFYWNSQRAERPPRGLTTTEGGQTASLYNIHGLTGKEGGQTANTPNGRISDLKVVTATVADLLWIELRSNRLVHRNLPLVFGVRSINTNPSRARHLTWPFEQHTWLSWAPLFLTQVFFDPLWVCEDLVPNLSDLSLVALVILQASIIDLLLFEVSAT
jgi:hypothetical protein